MKRWLGGALIAGAALLSLSACASIGTMDHDMSARIQSATTKDDHQALATHYEQEAKTLRAKAAEHRAQAQAYAKSPGYAKGQASPIQHCELLASRYQEAADQNVELAKQHRVIAAEAPK